MPSPTAYIVIQQGLFQTTPGFSTDQLVRNTPVVLHNANDNGVVSWLWQLMDVPQGSNAMLLTPMQAISGFTPDVPGTYLIRLTVNGTTYNQVGGAVATAGLHYRIPAITESLEFDYPNVNPGTQKGWGPAVNKTLKVIDDGYVGLVAALATTVVQLSPSVQQNGFINVSSFIRGDGGFVGPSLDTLGATTLSLGFINASSIFIGNSTNTTNINGVVYIDGYRINPAGSAANQALVYNGSAYVPQNISTGKASASDFALVDTSSHTIVSFLPAVAGNYMILIYYRVINSTTSLTITVTWVDGSGSDTITPVSGSQAVGAYTMQPIYVNNIGNAALPMSVTAQAGTANTVFVSASIMGL